MRVIQITDAITPADAIGNHILTLHAYFREQGYESLIFANYVHPRVRDIAKAYSEYEEREEDVILYHLGIGCKLNREVAKHRCKLVINYHNITPPKFFKGYSRKVAAAAEQGYEDLLFLKNRADAVVSDSDYNNRHLREIDYSCPMYHVPIILNFADYDRTPDEARMKALSDKCEKRILFVGRIAPNKKQEDIILDFYYYNRVYNPNSKLYLVGNYNHFEGYYLKLKKYVRKLGLEGQVIFPGHISFAQLLAYYRSADLLLCESEHEGFCVPLVEAMYFGIPIIAYDSSAIGETLADGGILLREKNPKVTAGVMNAVLTDEALAESIRNAQRERLKMLDYQTCASRYLSILQEIGR